MMLIDKGANFRAQTGDELTPLHLGTAQIDNKELLTTFLDRGVDVNAQTENGWTALHIAVRWESFEKVSWTLLERRADVTIRDHSGWTALHYLANFDGPESIFHELLRRGADLSLEDKEGNRALHYTLFGGSDALLMFLSAELERISPNPESPIDIDLQDEIGRGKVFCYLCPNDHLGHNYLVEAYRKLGMLSEACSSCDLFVETNPVNCTLAGVEDIIHSGVCSSCQRCGRQPRGIRYRCSAYPDFDLCAACYSKSDPSNYPAILNHQFLQILSDEWISGMISSGKFMVVDDRETQSAKRGIRRLDCDTVPWPKDMV